MTDRPAALPAPSGADPSAGIEAVFRRIAATRMAGVALLNPVLAVEAVGFRRWGEGWTGVLITPWFMSLICLPDPAAAPAVRCSGSRRQLDLPSGSYEFLTADEDELGPYLTSSLFSPMAEFADMDHAREVAAAVLAEVFTEAGPEPEPARAEPAGLAARLEQPVSRRGFFTALLRAGGKT